MSLARDIADNAAPVPLVIAKQLIWEGVGIDLSEWTGAPWKEYPYEFS